MNESVINEIIAMVKGANGPIKLKDAAEKLGYASSRGVAKAISSTYRHLEKNGDLKNCVEIARTFVNKWGNYSW